MEATHRVKSGKTRSEGALSNEVIARRQSEADRLSLMTGWPWDTRELAHFLARPMIMSSRHKAWRDEFVNATLRGEVEGVDLTAIAEEPGLDGSRKIRAALDQDVARLREIARILAVLHRRADQDKSAAPVDKLVSIILSKKANKKSCEAAFRRLKDDYDDWELLLDAPEKDVLQLVRGAGLEAAAARNILNALRRLKEEFGSCTLEPLRSMPADEVARFICSLPEITRAHTGTILFALGHTEFPVNAHISRILSKLQPFSALGIRLDGETPARQLQGILGRVIPPDLAASLHGNLISHGRKVCRPVRPQCNACELARFCESNRAEKHAWFTEHSAPTAVDLFCGAGGMSAGFGAAGFQTLAALDKDASSVRTFALNHPETPRHAVLNADIRDPETMAQLVKLFEKDTPDVLLGGPPCQGFSNAGNRSKRSLRARRQDAGVWESDDDRNFLFEYFVEAAAQLRPKVIVMENVPGMDASRRGQRHSFMQMAGLLLETAGYSYRIWELDAAAYGVPQNRIRKFLVASRTSVAPAAPAPQYRSRLRDLDRFPDLLPSLTVDDAISDLPSLAADDGDEVRSAEYTVPYDDRRLRHFVTATTYPVRGDGTLIYNHRSRYNNERDLELYSILRPGENGLDVVKRHGRGDLMRYRRDIFHDKYARMRPDAPSRTIVSHLSNDGNSYIHPSEVRSITPREGARLQSFRDDYVFCGSQSDQWRQIGNAVPPKLAMEIGTVVREHLERFF